MPIIIAFGLYILRLLSRPLHARLKLRQAGPLAVVALAVAVPVLWVLLRPAGVSSAAFEGELVGVWAVTMMSVSLMLGTRVRMLEPVFGGLDRMYLWHKRAAVVGTIVLPLHILLSRNGGTATASKLAEALGVLSLVGLVGLVLISLPTIGDLVHLPYRRWLLIHRLIGLWVILALVHGLLLDPVIARSPLLLAVYVTIGALGLVAYAYDELPMRRITTRATYRVERLTRPTSTILDLRLQPRRRPLPVRPGQFVFLTAAKRGELGRHPFSVAGAPDEGSLRLIVRAAGRDTTRMVQDTRDGQAVVVEGPHGGFDYTLAGTNQIWVGGGVGIAPYLGWLDRLRDDSPLRIALFYTTPDASDAVYLPELLAAEQRLSGVVAVHPVFSRTEGHLDGTRIANAAGLTSRTHVFLCGPATMARELTHDLRRLKIPGDMIHSERFAFR